jgi:hypothetical protein
MVRERHNNAASFLLSDREKGINGIFQEPADDLTFEIFARSLLTHVSAYGAT